LGARVPALLIGHWEVWSVMLYNCTLIKVIC